MVVEDTQWSCVSHFTSFGLGGSSLCLMSKVSPVRVYGSSRRRASSPANTCTGPTSKTPEKEAVIGALLAALIQNSLGTRIVELFSSYLVS